MSKRTANIAWAVGGLLLMGLILLSLCGCSAPAQTRITLPSTVPVRKAVAVASVHLEKADASNTRAQFLAETAQEQGIAANSANAQALVDATAATATELAQVKVALLAAVTSLGTLTAQLLDAQNQVNAVVAHDKIETARAEGAEAKVKHLRRDFVILVIGDLVMVTVCGAWLQEGIRLLLVDLWKLFLTGVSASRALLKTAFPAIFFWL